ncbi:hypothetical protein ECC23_04140 [Helicobacter pylori]|nr:hypothetical protein ECC23_04140 [Helicobacter pylori]
MRNPKDFFFYCIHACRKNIENHQNLRVVPNTFAFTEYNSLLQILSFGVISQKSEFFVKNRLNKSFYFLKMYLYI